MKIDRTKARSIGRRFLARNSGSFLRRSASVGLPSPVHTKASRARRFTRSGWRSAKAAARKRARRDAVDEERPRAARLEDVVGGGRKVVGAGGDVGIDVAALVGAAVAFHVDAPGVETLRCEEVHGRGIGDARHREVEGRLRGHRRAVHEQDRAGPLGRAGALLPQEQPDIALRRPMLLPLNGGRPADRLVHCAAPGCSGGCLPSAPRSVKHARHSGAPRSGEPGMTDHAIDPPETPR